MVRKKNIAIFYGEQKKRLPYFIASEKTKNGAKKGYIYKLYYV